MISNKYIIMKKEIDYGILYKESCHCYGEECIDKRYGLSGHVEPTENINEIIDYICKKVVLHNFFDFENLKDTDVKIYKSGNKIKIVVRDGLTSDEMVDFVTDLFSKLENSCKYRK